MLIIGAWILHKLDPEEDFYQRLGKLYLWWYAIDGVCRIIYKVIM